MSAPARPLRRRLAALAPHLVLIAGAAFMCGPFVWMVLTSLKPAADIFSSGFALPTALGPALDNYHYALTGAPLLRFMLNGVIVCAGILVVQVTTAVFAAYALAKLSFRGRDIIFAAILFGLAVPTQVPAIPIFVALAHAGLLNSYFALMFPFFASFFGIFLLRQFFMSYPDEIIDAARLDGLSEFEIVVGLLLPSAWPAIAAFATFSVAAHWNDLYWPLIVVRTPDMGTAPLGMMYFRDSQLGSNYGALMAAATIVLAPLLAVFLVARRYFVQGVTMTGLK